MSKPEDDDFFEEDEPAEEIFEFFASGEGGVTSLPPGGQPRDAGSALVGWRSVDQAGGQVIATDRFVSIWRRAGHHVTDREALVQA